MSAWPVVISLLLLDAAPHDTSTVVEQQSPPASRQSPLESDPAPPESARMFDWHLSDDPEERLLAVVNLARMSSEARSAIPALQAMLDGPDRHLRLAAAVVLTRVDSSAEAGRAGAVLRAFAATPESVDATLLSLLTQFAETTEPVERLLAAILRAPDYGTPAEPDEGRSRKVIAIEALGRVPMSRRAAVLPHLRHALEHGDRTAQVNAAWVLRGFGAIAAEATPQLDRLLASGDPCVRAAAAGALWRIQPTPNRALPRHVGEALPEVPRAWRRFAIGWVRDMGAAVPRAASVVLTWLDDETSEPEHEVEALLGDSDLLAADDIEALVGRLGADPRGRTSGVLSRLGPRAVPALSRGLLHVDARIRARAAALLADAGSAGTTALPLLLHALADADLGVRLATVHTLSRMPADSRALPTLVQMLERESDRSLRCAAARAIARFGPQATPAVPVLSRLLADSDATIQAAAAETLAAIGAPVEPGSLLAQLRQGTPFLRVQAVRHLATLGARDAAVTGALLDSLRDSDAEVRYAAAEALSLIDAARFPEALPVLQQAFDPAARIVRSGVLRALMTHGAAAVPILAAHVQAAGPQAESAVMLLSDMPAGTPGVSDALLSAIASPDAGIRSAALSAAARGHLPATALRTQVASGLRDTNGMMRFSAFTAMAEAGPSSGETWTELRRIAQDAGDPLRPFALEIVAREDPTFARAHLDGLQDLLARDVWMDALVAAGVGSMSGDPRVGAMAVLGSLGHDARPALPALRTLARDDDLYLRSHARVAVARIEGTVPALLDALRAELQVPDGHRVAQALITVSALGREAASVVHLLESLAEREADPLAALVASAIEAVRAGR